MPISCRVTRGELTESIHVAFAVVIDKNGQILFSSGDPNFLTCVRSSLKPFQAAASIQSGAIDLVKFNQQEIALMCASHQGESIHLKTAESMLEKLYLSVDDYECGSHMPYEKNARYELIKKNQTASVLHNNCSGKHAGMLALAKYLDQGFSDYIKMDHPVQKFICNYISEISGIEDITYEIDGCSAPTPFMSLESIARLFQKLASQDRPELNKVFDAMVEYPLLVGGSNNFDSIFINALKGMGITKVGGESVRGIALNTKNHGPIGLAIKILDGNLRAMPIVTMKLLEHLELLSDKEVHQLHQYRTKNLRNHNNLKIGKIEAYIDF